MAAKHHEPPGRNAPEVDPDDALARSMRPSSGPWLRGVLLNVGLAAVLLGGPWVRGMLRAEHSIAAYGRLAACLTGGSAETDGGLALPDGDRAAFAGMLRRDEPDWPARCLPELEALRPDDAMFVLPGPKEHEADVRAMATLLRGELERVHASPDGDVPASVLTVLGRLQGSLTELADSANARVEVRALAITLPDDEGTSPTRLPLTVIPATTDLHFTAEGIDVVAADPRRVAVLRVRGGTVHEEHERRSPGARALWVAPDASASLLFTTAPDVCSIDSEHCARHMTGLVATDGTAVTERSAARWLGGHLEGRADRSVRIEESRVRMIAATVDGGRELRTFDWSSAEEIPSAPSGDMIDAEATEATEAEAPRHRARTRIALGSPRDALLTSTEVLWTDGHSLRRASLLDGELDGEPVDVPLNVSARRLWACGPFVVAAATDGLEVLAHGRSVGVQDVAPRAPLEVSSEPEDPIQLACNDELLLIGAVRAGPRLDVLACDETACRVIDRGSRPVHGVDVAVTEGEAWVAEWGPDGAHQVVLRQAHLGPIGGMALRSAPPLPPCWSDRRGFCAPATFASDGRSLALYTHEQADLLVLVLQDGSLQGLPGLR